MNPTPDPTLDASMLRALNGVEEYKRRAQAVVSGGSKTAKFDLGVEAYTNGDMLHGDTPPSQVINKEQPVHVLMCYMQASGKDTQEIATATGYSLASIRNIQRQPWYRARFLRLTATEGGDNVRKFLDGQVMSSLETLVEIRDENKTSRPHVSAAAANSILDRAMGKPTQHVETESHSFTHPAQSVDEINQQIAAMDAELKSRGHGTVGPN
jgi:hypothetical protein